MKKQNLFQSLKSKNFYVVLFVAVIAIAAVATVGLNLQSKNTKKQDLVDLNSKEHVVQNDDTNKSEDMKSATNSTDVAKNEDQYTNDELLEFDVGSYTQEEGKEETQVADASDVTKQKEQPKAQAKEESKEEESVSVMKSNAKTKGLSFSKDSTIAWPVKGNVIMPFSTDKVIHYATLGEWKTNPAIVISSEKGTEVTAAVKGVVSSVAFDDETGMTVTMDIGDGYEIVYGQLDKVNCAAGDVVTTGTVIGQIADPTKYYSVEGSNLYLEIRCDGVPVNPMLFLAEE